jgi:hypothetical protein
LPGEGGGGASGACVVVERRAQLGGGEMVLLDGEITQSLPWPVGVGRQVEHV